MGAAPREKKEPLLLQQLFLGYFVFTTHIFFSSPIFRLFFGSFSIIFVLVYSFMLKLYSCAVLKIMPVNL